MSEVSIRRLRYFVTLAHTLHFGRAAALLFISQPALSNEIKKLETDFGAPLLIRKPHTALTRQGEILRSRAEVLLTSVDRFRTLAEGIASGGTGDVQIGCVQTFFNLGLPEGIKEIERRHPDLRIRIIELPTVEQLELLENGAIDIACCHQGASSVGLVSTQVIREPFRLCTSWDSRAESIMETQGQPFIIFRREASPLYWEKVISICNSLGVSPQIDHQATTWNAVVSLIQHGLGAALIPASVADSSSGIRTVEIDPVGIFSESWMHMRRADSGTVVEQVFREISDQYDQPR